MKTISIKKVSKAIKEAYHVTNDEALELVPMFTNYRKAA